MTMKLRFPESEISYWANRYTERQREKDRIKEQELIDFKSGIQARGYLTKEELHKIARWKSPRRAALTLENDDDFIKEVTERAFTATDNWSKLLTLTQLQGVGQPTCTAIGNSGHCLNQDCDIMTISLKGASDGETKKIHSRI